MIQRQMTGSHVTLWDKFDALMFGLFLDKKAKAYKAILAILVILALAITLAILAGCGPAYTTGQGPDKTQDYILTSYKFLDSSANIYEKAMQSVQELYLEGHLNDERIGKIRKIAAAYHAAYHSAVEALIAYKRTQSAEAQEQTETAIAETARLAGELLGYIRPFLEEEGA